MPSELSPISCRPRPAATSFLLFAGVFLLSLRIGASEQTEWRGSAKIEFAGTSTLHDWSGTVNSEPFTAIVVMDDNDKPKSLAAKVTVKVAKMDTKKEKRDENMRETMKAIEFPLISGTFDTLFSKVMKPGDKAPSKLPFTLNLLGRDQQVEAAISNWSLKDSTATFDLDFDLSLKTCGIEVPSVVYVIRVGDTIKLHASVKLSRS